MSGETFLNDRVRLFHGDCREVLATLPENSLDAAVTDPPYHLISIIKRFGKPAGNFGNGYGSGFDPKAPGLGGAFARTSRGFMGQQWDGGDIAFDPETWRAVLRVLKPGAHTCVFCIPKHIGLVQVAMQEAGFEFRDMIGWLFGVGFPKSHDVSKGIDKASGVPFEALPASGVGFMGPDGPGGWNPTINQLHRTGESTDAAREWEGWGTALKPAMELIILARKPLSEKSVAANVLRWGTGAINIDGCRVGTEQITTSINTTIQGGKFGGGVERASLAQEQTTHNGRWPANLTHDGSEEVVGAFPDVGGSTEIRELKRNAKPDRDDGYGMDKGEAPPNGASYADGSVGSAARFFYTAKADSDDRIGSRHPTIKPLDLIQYLVRLITPPRGTVLDCFAGSGTTGEAAFREGKSALLIEREEAYCVDIRRRMALALAGPDERARESIKAKNLPRDDGPLFAACKERGI